VALPGRPIVFPQQRGARATIDGTLRADGSDLVFWGFEITQSNPAGGSYGSRRGRNNGRFINLIIHGAGSMGVSFWTPGENAELYGCIVYHNGTHENLDHGVYVHNERAPSADRQRLLREPGVRHPCVRRTGQPPQREHPHPGQLAFNNGMGN